MTRIAREVALGLACTAGILYLLVGLLTTLVPGWLGILVGLSALTWVAWRCARRGARWQPVVIVLALVLALVVVGFPVALRAHFEPSIPAPAFPPPTDRIEAWHQDLDHFGHYLRWNRAYSDSSRAAAQELADGLRSRIDSLTDSEIKLGVAQAVALSENGHSTVWIPQLTLGVGRIPLMGRMFNDGYYFLRSTPEYAHLLGTELVSIDGHPVEEVIAAFRPYSGAVDGLFRLVVGWFLETPGLVHAVGMSGDPTGYSLGLRREANGEVEEVEIAVAGPTPEHPVVGTVLVMRPSHEPQWKSLVSHDSELPRLLQGLDEAFTVERLPEIDGLYVRYTANEDVGAQRITAFNEKVEESLRAEAPSVLILDQRLNGGGDYTLTVDTMKWIPRHLPTDSRIYVLTGPLTFSAGISSVAFIKASGGSRVTIVGEHVGDRERMWGETTSLILPNSQVGMSLATGLHDYRDGCHELPDCYWLDFFNNVAVGSLAPDVRVAFTFADYMAGRDGALEAVFEMEAGNSE